MLYEYDAWNEDGKPVKGTLLADTLKEAQAALRARHLSVDRIRPSHGVMGRLKMVACRAVVVAVSGGVTFSVMASQGMGHGISLFIGAGAALLSVCLVVLMKQSGGA